jgi:hypothetical protein
MQPDDDQRKLKQDLAESDAAAGSATRREPRTEEDDESQCDDAPPSPLPHVGIYTDGPVASYIFLHETDRLSSRGLGQRPGFAFDRLK